jgi:hypothetical protein
LGSRVGEFEVWEILAERMNAGKSEYLVQWEGYRPEDDTLEPLSNLQNAKGALQDFKVRGQTTKGGRYHVTSSITEEIKEKREADEERTSSVLSGSQVTISNAYDTNCASESCQELTDGSEGEWDSGTPSRRIDASAQLTGKLCRHVMALIQWKVGADRAVSEHVVQALEEWLHRWGISIYTDLL